MAIAQRAVQRPAPHVVAALAATRRIRIRPTPRRRAAAAAGAVSAGPAAAEGRAGREQVRPWCIRLPRCGRSRRSAKASRSEDVFLCHAWDDRGGAAKELHDLLESRGVSVWFSEKDVVLGTSLLREIDKGLAKSRVGIVLVTPALLSRLRGEGIADKELSALLARDLLVSRSGLSTAEEPMADVAAKLAELVAL